MIGASVAHIVLEKWNTAMYRVIWTQLPEKSVIRMEFFSALNDALKEADIRLAVRQTPIEISVVDEQDVTHFTRVCG